MARRKQRVTDEIVFAHRFEHGVAEFSIAEQALEVGAVVGERVMAVGDDGGLAREQFEKPGIGLVVLVVQYIAVVLVRGQQRRRPDPNRPTQYAAGSRGCD